MISTILYQKKKKRGRKEQHYESTYTSIKIFFKEIPKKIIIKKYLGKREDKRVRCWQAVQNSS